MSSARTPAAGHVDDDACTPSLVASFFEHAEPGALDASCAAGSRRPPFTLK